ncbi:beta strand repeat-containing protein, partial [Pararhodobacter aggregans]|uniref:beta strand repeat-containing protein n=2 Tax=Pararhodobacter aggregans TaxID=404875 RepID=UPI001B85ECF8
MPADREGPANGVSGLAVLNVTSDPDCNRPIVSNTSLPNGRQGQSYGQTISVSGGTSPYSYSVSGLPAGLSQSGSVISGTPTVQGTFSVVVRVTGQNGGYEEKTLSLTIDPPLYTALMTGHPQALTYTNPNPSIAGANVSLAVYLVSSSGVVWPTGTITATSGGWSCSGSLTQGAPAFRSLLEAACPALPVGTHSILVSYSGDSQHTPNSITISHTVVPAAPTIASISPPALTIGGGTFVITGTNLSTTTSVTIGGIAGTVTVNSDTQLTVATAGTTVGTKTVEVTTAGGTATGSLTFYTETVVTTVSTYTLAASGGTTVTLGGTGFVGITSVTVDGTAATSFSIDSVTSMSFVAPAGSGGSIIVRLVKEVVSGFTSQRNLSGFAYAAPLTWVTTSLPDATLGSAYSQSVSATGGIGAITYDATGILPVGLALSSSGTISWTPATTGTFSLDLTATAGVESTPTTLTLTVTANPPTLTGITPNNYASVNAPTTRSLIGTNLTGVTDVTLAGSSVSFTPVSNTQIDLTLPATAADGAATIEVTTPGGTATIPFYFYRPLTVSSISPSTLPASGGTVTITGTGFTGALGNVSSILVGAVNAGTATNITVVNDTTITATFPARAPEVGARVFLSKPASPSLMLLADGTVTYAAAPSVNPGLYAAEFSGNATLTGVDLDYVSNATLGGAPVFFTVPNSGQLQFTAPASGTHGLNTLTLTVPGGTINVDVYLYSVPVLSSATPAQGASTGGETITLAGSGFVGAYDLVVSIGGTDVTATVVSDTQATFVTPALIAGPYTVQLSKGITPSTSFCCSVQVAFSLFDPPALSVASLPDGQVGAAYSQTITATSGATPYAFAATGLPDGLSMSSAGTISGTPTEAGTFSVTLTVTDNNTLQDSLTLPLIIAKAGTSLSLDSSVNPAVLGSGVTFTATLAGGDGPTGEVSFFDGATLLGTGTLTGGVATLTTGALSTGTHEITAHYAGDANHAAATSPVLSQVIAPLSPELSLVSSVNPAVLGSGVTFTATLAGGDGPTGEVSFFDGATLLGTGTLTGGAATLTTGALSTGTHEITAHYAGDSNHAAATSPVLSQVIAPLSPELSLVSSVNPAVLGSGVTFTATLAGGDGPTGEVSFFDGATLLGTGTLTGGAATLTTGALSTGTHEITAHYAGDANHAAATSPVLSQVIAPLSPELSLVSSVNPAVLGSGVTFTATLAGGDGPTGEVSFFDGATLLGTGTLTGGVATLTTGALSTGTHEITAHYAGDVNHAAATSP